MNKPKPVDQYDLQGDLIASYPSIKEAVEAVSGCAFVIKYACSGTNGTAYGFRWKFKNDADSKVCDMDCFHCKFSDCKNANAKRTSWELYALSCAGL